MKQNILSGVKLSTNQMKSIKGGCYWYGCNGPSLDECIRFLGLRCDYDANGNLLPSIEACMQYCAPL